MAGDFFKGEKKKKKKGSSGQFKSVSSQASLITSAPVFTPPEVVVKGKNKY